MVKSRRQFIRSAFALTLLAWKGSAWAEAAALRLGTLPVVSTRTAYELYLPLVKYLESSLKQQVNLETPPNFKDMYQRILRNDFDLLVSPPHIARLAQKKLGWHPLVMCKPEHHSELMVMEKGGPQTLDELRGATIAVLDKNALVVMVMFEALAKKGLHMGRDFKVLETRGYESSQMAVKQGIAQAMVSRSQGFLNQDERDRMSVLFQAGVLPGYVVIAAPSMSREQMKHMQKFLLAFSGTAEANAFLGKLGYETFTAAAETELRRLDSYLEVTEASLR